MSTRRFGTRQEQSRTLRAPRLKLSRTSSTRSTSRRSQQFLAGRSPTRPDSPVPASVCNINAQGTIRCATSSGGGKGRQSLEVLQQHIGQHTTNLSNSPGSRHNVDDVVLPDSDRSPTPVPFSERIVQAKTFEAPKEVHSTKGVLNDTQAKRTSPPPGPNKEVQKSNPKSRKENQPVSLDHRVVEVLTNQQIPVVWHREVPKVQTVKIRPFVKYSTHWDVEEGYLYWGGLLRIFDTPMNINMRSDEPYLSTTTIAIASAPPVEVHGVLRDYRPDFSMEYNSRKNDSDVDVDSRISTSSWAKDSDGWYMTFAVPLHTSLFKSKESRYFRLKGQVTFMSGHRIITLTSRTIVTVVELLKRGREMMLHSQPPPEERRRMIEGIQYESCDEESDSEIVGERGW